MAGLISVVAFDELWKVGKYIYYGIMASQNRGQDRYFVSLSNGKELLTFEDCSSTLQSNNNLLLRAEGYVGIGGVFTSNELRDVKYIHLSDGGFAISVIVDGVIDKQLIDLGKDLIKLVKSGKDLAIAFTEVVTDLNGVYSLIAISNKDEVIAYRSPPGLKPLHIGSYGFDLAIVSTESTPISVLGGDLKRSIRPGELIYITPEYVKSINVYDVRKPTLCSFEYVYMARPDSVMDGIDVYNIRKSLGQRLAKTFKYDVDVVVGVPDTALPYAIGFANALDKELDLGFISTGTKYRTAIKEDPRDRLIGVQLKLNPIKCVLSKRRVAVVDDSLVRGVTMKNVVQILRNKLGVKEVHVVIGSPKLMSGCPYGMEIPPADELLSANLDNELSTKYIEADSLTWLSIDDITELFSVYGVEVCLRCFLTNHSIR